MKKIISLMLIFAMLLCVGCAKLGKNTEEGIMSPDGIEYYECKPMGLYPVDPQDELFKTKDKNGTETTYYSVYFENPENFICYEIEGNYFLLHNSSKPEPTISEFNPIAAGIYASGNTVHISNFYADNQYLPDDKKEHSSTEDSWLCQMIAEYLTNGEQVDVPVTSETIQDHYHIRLYSQDYPGLYYLVSFFGYNGRYFLRDSSAGKTVYCPNDIILRMVGE